ncbi:hypothetical protein GQ44DRAFT_702372 [Phaeosphaeriaceae sp. PMI808]|nr:hypothetical protein GQ44DRAFT_702372 [Phaeosphaeriaceae sp. PMI808]
MIDQRGMFASSHYQQPRNASIALSCLTKTTLHNLPPPFLTLNTCSRSYISSCSDPTQPSLERSFPSLVMMYFGTPTPLTCTTHIYTNITSGLFSCLIPSLFFLGSHSLLLSLVS